MSEYIEVAESEQAASSVELETEDDGMCYFPNILWWFFQVGYSPTRD